MKKFYVIIGTVCIIWGSCSSKINYSGTYKKVSGNCRHEYILLKKVQGFDDKYYLVQVHKKDGNLFKEYLGVISNRTIIVGNGRITLFNTSIAVSVGDKNCVYNRTGSYGKIISK